MVNPIAVDQKVWFRNREGLKEGGECHGCDIPKVASVTCPKWTLYFPRGARAAIRYVLFTSLKYFCKRSLVEARNSYHQHVVLCLSLSTSSGGFGRLLVPVRRLFVS